MEETVGQLKIGFKDFLASASGGAKTKNTIRCYLGDISSFLNQSGITRDDPLTGVTSPRRLAQTVSARLGVFFALGLDYAPSTKRRALSSVNSFFLFLKKNYKIQTNDLHLPKPLKIKRGPIKIVSEPEFQRIMSQIPSDKSFMRKRDRAILSLMFFQGLRLEEITSMDYSNIVRENNFPFKLLINQTLSRIRENVLDEYSIRELESYEEGYALAVQMRDIPRLKQLGTPYFRNKSGMGISGRSIRRNLVEYVIKAGLEPDISPNTFRQSYAQRRLAGTSQKSLGKEIGMAVETLIILNQETQTTEA